MEHSEISFEQEIKPLFRERDRQAIDYAFDLADYQDVRDNASAILEQVETGRMPCDTPWSDEQIDLFRRWIEAGMPE